MRQIHLHVCRAYPDEGCGVLVGRERGEVREIERVIGLENRHGAPREKRYLIAPEEFLDADRRAREQGLEVLGFFHSHPDAPAEPSSFDLEHAWDYYSYLIVSISNGAVAGERSWRLRADRSGFDPEPLEIPNRTAPDAVKQ
jgi:proteasome lid subunit RPN8/RPN11